MDACGVMHGLMACVIKGIDAVRMPRQRYECLDMRGR